MPATEQPPWEGTNLQSGSRGLVDGISQPCPGCPQCWHEGHREEVAMVTEWRFHMDPTASLDTLSPSLDTTSTDQVMAQQQRLTKHPSYHHSSREPTNARGQGQGVTGIHPSWKGQQCSDMYSQVTATFCLHGLNQWPFHRTPQHVTHFTAQVTQQWPWPQLLLFYSLHRPRSWCSGTALDGSEV